MHVINDNWNNMYIIAELHHNKNVDVNNIDINTECKSILLDLYSFSFCKSLIFFFQHLEKVI